MEYILVVVIGVVIVKTLYFTRQGAARRAAEHKTAIRRRYGREPDMQFEIANAGEDRRLCYAYFAEQTLYIGNVAGRFDERNVLTPDVVRSWYIETSAYGSGGAVRTGYSVHIHTTRIDRALVQIRCKDAGEAHMVQEVVNQALGGAGTG